MALLYGFLIALSVVPVSACLYLGMLTVLSQQLSVPRLAGRHWRFDIIVPAHNEETGIARTVASLLAVDWPRSAYRVIVVADNCTDNTSAFAAQAGAEVWPRDNPQERGKGYALAYALQRSIREREADAVVIVDADTDVSTNILAAFAARLEQGAEAVQATHSIRDFATSWRTCLTAIAYAAFHTIRSRARERLGVSCGLRGNGMCFAHRLLQRIPYQAYSLAEDVEYGIQLGLHGVRVWYAEEAQANAESASSATAAGRQRQRWEGGRRGLFKRYALPLLAATVRSKSKVCFDLLADLLTPPLAQLLVWLGGLLALTATGSIWVAPLSAFVIVYLACMGLLIAHVARGWQLSGTGKSGLRALAFVPYYVLWKLVARATYRGNQRWIRTDRN